MCVLAGLLLLLAPEETHKLAYRFRKGMVYEEAAERSFALEMLAQGKRLVFDSGTKAVLRRTILAVDRTHHPTLERVEVVTLTHTITKWPDKEAGTKALPAQGRTFVWKRLEKRWALFGKGDVDVTKRHPQLVERLKNWRDERLPQEAVAVGGSWEVSARRFMETTGRRVPKDARGKAIFNLKRVEKGIATIEFEFHLRYEDGGSTMSGVEKGTWRFDVARGRDLGLETTGTLLMDGGRRGRGALEMERKVTYLKRSASASRPRGS